MASGLMCPHCGSTNLRGPSPAMMEDGYDRLTCAICIRRFTYDVARCAFIRHEPKQGRGDKPIGD
jgi:hypothetical protein